MDEIDPTNSNITSLQNLGGTGLKSTFQHTIRTAFVVDEQFIEKIHDLLADRIGKVSVTAECADNVSREFTSIRQLVEFENPNPKRINNLILKARSEDALKHATVKFLNEWYSKGIFLSIDGRDDVVTRLRSDLLDILGGMQPWYKAIHRIDFVFAAIVIYGIVWILLLVVFLFNGSRTHDPLPDNQTNRSEILAQITVYGFLGFLFGIAYLLHHFRSRVFPYSTYRIGQGIIRDDYLEKWRWGGVVSFIISFVGGIIMLAIQFAIE